MEEAIAELGNWGKIYESVFERSMVGSGSCTYAVWCYCIAKAKPPRGIVELNPKLLATILGDHEKTVQSAIDRLCSPDKKTHTPGFDGQRLEHIGAYSYRMVNWKLYRGPKSPTDLREYYAKKQREYRARKRAIHGGAGLGVPNIHI